MEQQIIKVKNKRGVKVIPGFKFSLGVTLAMLGTLVLIPLASIFISASQLSLAEFIDVVTSKQVVSGYVVSLSCAFFAALVNVVSNLRCHLNISHSFLYVSFQFHTNYLIYYLPPL